MTYGCMTEDELALWRESRVRGRSPCVDCPRWFEVEEREAGRCTRISEERRQKMRDYMRRRHG